MSSAPRTILAIDTSCDDTSVAVVQGTRVMSNVVASQTQLHKQYGGVFPSVAKQAHKENLSPTTKAALQRANMSWADIDAVAVTQGPGLAPALETGISFAKELAVEHTKPLIPVNHIEGHVLSVLAVPKTKTATTSTPQNALAVIVSGGHTEFVLVNKIGEYEVLGQTVDDAAGEVLDKVGRMLDLGYPAGPVIEEFAKKGDDTAFTFPLPMTMSGDFNMSFSGMKTAARNKIEVLTAEGKLDKQAVYDFCASFQKAVFRAITYKLNKVLEKYKVSEVWLGGGVAANMSLRAALRTAIKPYGLKLRVPYTKKLCSDNAAMIGVVAGWKEAKEKTFERLPRLHLEQH